jgi:hypothetical protein
VLPLAEQTALTFTTPLFVTLLAVPSSASASDPGGWAPWWWASSASW